MALLDYKCGSCGENFSELVSSWNRDQVKCPKCGSPDVKQVYEGKANFVSKIKESSKPKKCGG